MKRSWLYLNLGTLVMVFPLICHAVPTIQPGSYRDWNRYFDEVTVLKPIPIGFFRSIDIAPIQTGRVRLPNPDENTYRAVTEVLSASMRPFSSGFKEKLSNKTMAVRIGETNSGGLLIRTEVIRIDPGSQAARYWGSFSAGAAIVEMSGEIVDERSGDVLVQFRQERRSGWGLLGGGYHALLDRNLKQIGGDVAGLVNVLAGSAPTELKHATPIPRRDWLTR